MIGNFQYVGLGYLLGRGRAAVLQATTECAEDLVGKAQERAPNVSGTLEGSIHVESVEQSAFTVTATVATGGESSDYAAIVHDGHRSDGSYARVAGPSKFLEGPLIEESPVYREFMARAARAAY